MEASIPINGWTTALDCVAWSHDNVIAVGVRDGVALLVPRTDTSSEDEPFWKVANLEVGNFSLEEIPTREPLPWSYFSIGQEISERHVVSVQWSPPGLGTFGRCILAVLFANQVVAIYDCDGRLEAKESWSRVNLVNKTLEDAIPNMQRAPQPSPRSERAQQERSLRITSLCWLPPPQTHNAQDLLQARLSKKTYLLAVCDENAELRILRVHPPLDLIRPSQHPWRTEIIDSCSLIPNDHLPDPINACLPSGALVPVVGHVDRISCSPWIWKDDNTIVATVAYTYGSALFLTTFTASLSNDVFQVIFRTSPERIGSHSIRSPLQWLPNSTDQRQNTLVYFTDDGFTKLDVMYSEVPEMRETVINSSSPTWSLFAALQCISPRPGQVEVCAPRSQSDFQDEDTLHLLHTDARSRASSPPWAKRIDKLKRRFNRERTMNGNISVCVHGFATSPLGDFSAPSISFHPRHGLEYSIIAKQEANVVVTRTHPASEDRFLMTDPSIIVSHAVAAEVVFQAVTRLKKLDAIPDVGNIQQEVLRCMGYYGGSDANAPHALPRPNSLNMAVHELRTILFRVTSAIQLRSQRMIEIALGLRISNTPRGSPKLVNAQKSPVHSIRPKMELHRDEPSASYMDIDSSDDEDHHLTTVRPADLGQKESAHRSHFNTRDGGLTMGETAQKPLTDPSPPGLETGSMTEPFPHIPPDDIRFNMISGIGNDPNRVSIGSSFDGSVTEMQFGDDITQQQQPMNKLRHKGHLPSGMPEPQFDDDQTPILADVDQSQAMLEALKATLSALQQQGDRKTMTPPPPQTNRNSQHITKPSAAMSIADSQLSTKAVRKVSVVPPAIDVTHTRSFKSKPIPSPYPIARNRPIRERLASPRSDYSIHLRDSTLHLRLHCRHHSRHRNRLAQTTSISIPPALVADYSTIKTGPSKEKEKHFRALDYDDASFALSLHKAYTSLLPLPYRLFAARSLVRITVSGPVSKSADRTYGWIHPSHRSRPSTNRTVSASGYEVSATASTPRDGTFSASASSSPGMKSPSFNEEKLLALYRRPKQAKARYAWVGWARKIADAEEQGRGMPLSPGAATAEGEVIDVLAERMAGIMRELTEGVKEVVLNDIAMQQAGLRSPGGESSRGVSGAGLSVGQGQGQGAGLGGNAGAGHQRSASARYSGFSPVVEERSPGVPMTPFSVSTAKSGKARVEEDEDEFEGLQFVLGWDVSRMVAFLVVVVLLAVAAALLWIFLGPRNGAGFLVRPVVVQEGGAGGVSGLRGAGDRVGAGVVLGICTLLVGLTGFGAWVGASWLVI
ncbi:hypothetical protein KVT40_008111 [Elsinoe batatas]|uniref:Transcription factor IIIC 90kDa subunit N-terminal domain-containing protein n=1 Tax=Elsinoe batatas TaxID=2601811 RepID=A0A8K0KTR0_9PEZI|nr:hypothetical protein KVT40_008111 [Elsinoe batatas]